MNKIDAERQQQRRRLAKAHTEGAMAEINSVYLFWAHLNPRFSQWLKDRQKEYEHVLSVLENKAD